jgi:Domain of unknown function (DUF4179)
MPIDLNFRRRSSEPLEGGDDADAAGLVRDLAALAAATARPRSLPASFDAVLARKDAVASRTPWRFRRFPGPLYQLPRAVVVPVAALLILALAGAAYAAHSVLEQAFTMNGGTQQIVAGNLGREINQSRTVDGFTMTVHRAYADPNSIVIGFTLTGPPNRQFNSMILFGTYEDARGQRLNSPPGLTDEGGSRFAGGLAAFAPGVQNGTGAALLKYTPEDVTPGQDLNLHLHAGAIEVIEALPSAVNAAAHEPPCDELLVGNLCDFTVRGNFDFQLTIPVDGGHAIPVNRTVVSNGTPVTLERVALGATGASIVLRGAGPSARVTASINGVTYPFERPVGLAIPDTWSPQSEDSYVSQSDLRGEKGTWTVRVSPGEPLPPRVAPQSTPLTGGPWAFRVVVP